ncbi:P-loop containing nucleoside triphosphate hydrolase protein [Microstroma glucosiphilum]|uniref:P-loop containing nucleoside triphosphate hydrolase protein n=1 Tax=Pseudomicrostroma glucosiphilum TaxID=1684307 RepID=A0A316U6V8_9BASI|nr:P-loop containing nucleoside triphosphate hydrolase protein [Pseudomicrostroma glucosiphilum]PWN20083.1 P-loop containing nucleoside triphosphate hydrolase protein [Pseudomicrostroma glucosiphilum]
MSALSTSQVGLQRSLPLRRNIVQLFQDILTSPQFWDGLKVFGVGAAIAGSKWIAESALAAVKSLVLSKAVFRGGDEAFDWVMLYLTRYGQWSHTAREVEILCRPKLGGTSHDEGGEEAGAKALSVGKDGLKGVHFYPVESSSVHFTFEGVHVWASRSRTLVGEGFEESLTLSFLTFSSRTIRRFLTQAKESYDTHERGRVQVFTTDRYSYWAKSKSITRRMEDSVHLPLGMKERLLKDARDFFTEEMRIWYGDRGIPYRRGFLFWGVPGSGKTSLAHVVASSLELPIYQLSLSGHGMDDAKLVELMGSVPPGSIVVLEDVDAAFTKRPDSSSTSTAKQNDGPSSSAGSAPSSSISFSSLLNAIDGIGACDSRLLIMTTNHREALDEALIRPGRVDLQVQFKNADREQARDLFLRWFLPAHTAVGRLKGEGQHGRIAGGGQVDKTSTGDKRGGASIASQEQHATSDAELGSSDEKSLAGLATSAAATSPSALQPSAEKFASTIPEGRFSVAALQGYLLTCGGLSPTQAAEGVQGWVREQEQ